MVGFGCASVMVCEAVDQIGRVDRSIFVSATVDVYDVQAGSVHGDGSSRDRDQSRDWCAFAVRGSSLDQTVPARAEQPVLASGTGRSGNRQPSSSEGLPTPRRIVGTDTNFGRYSTESASTSPQLELSEPMLSRRQGTVHRRQVEGCGCRCES